MAAAALSAQPPVDQSIELTLPPAQAPTRVTVSIELNDAPAALVYARVIEQAGARDAQTLAAAAAAARAQIPIVDAAQAQIAGVIAGPTFNAAEIYRVRRAMNAIVAVVDAGSLAALSRLAGVRTVRPMELEFPHNSSGVPFIGAPSVWNGVPGATGAGIRVGIIDTGVDYQHAAFGGTGLLADYQANDRTIAPDTYFPTSKVAGGIDFAGDAYTGSNTPTPDDDPMDCNGHGTHVAGTAAGLGVNADGTTFTGPFGPSTPFSSLRIGPGSAPAATLYALRVFGCTGGTSLTVQAIDWAMDPNGDLDLSDHLDVINMSLGSSYGSLSSTSAAAADNAAAAGVIVVTSAGNSGDTYFISGSPGSGNRVISTAASADSGVPGAAVHVNAPVGIVGDYVAGTASFGPPAPLGGITGNVVIGLDPADGAGPLTTDGCSPLTNAAAIAGNIALIDRGTCGYTIKVKNAQNAGAIAVIIANNTAGAPGMAGTDNTITIPSVLVSQADGNTFKANIPGLNATLASAADTMASFSSRGPRFGATPFQLKPDIAAPGVAITSAQTGVTCTAGACQRPDASGYVAGSLPLVLQGTSMAAPHVAGVMALLRQLHPTWTVEELKALVMNTALHDVTVFPSSNGARYGPGRVGGGRVDAALAAQSSVLAFNADDDGMVGVSFDGRTFGAASRTKRLRIVNHGVTAQTYDLAIDTVVDAAGASYSLPGGNSVTVPAEQAIEIEVLLTTDALQMDHTREATVAGTQPTVGSLAGLGTLARHWLTEEAGYVTLSQSGTRRLRVPIYTAPIPYSSMTAPSTLVTGGAGTGSTTIPLAGTDLCTGTLGAGPSCTGSLPTDVASLVTPFELQVVSPADPASLPPSADLQYAGVAYVPTGDLLIFGVSTWGAWSSPTETAFNIYLDIDNSGTWDRVLFNTNTGTMAQVLGTNTSGTDTFMNFLLDISTSGISANTTNRFLNRVDAAAADTHVFDNQVAFLSFSRTSLGITGGFRYKVLTCPGTTPLCQVVNGFHYDEAEGPYFWNYTAQGLDFGGTNLAFDLNGSALPVTWNTTNLATNGSLGALLLHHHNRPGERAEVMLMDGVAQTDLGITLTVSPTATPAVEETVTFTAVVTNHGATAAANVQVAFALPSTLLYNSDDGGGAYDSLSQTWTIPTLAASASATLHLVVTDVAPGAVTTQAMISSASLLDPEPGNNVATQSVTAPSRADLEITAAPVTSPVVAGNAAAFTLQLTNHGDETAYNVLVTSNATAGGAIQSGTPTVGLFDSTTRQWRIASLGSGASATLTLGAFAANGPLLTIQSMATSSVSDPVGVNNTASASVTVTTRPTSLTLGLSPTTVGVGATSMATAVVVDTTVSGASRPTGQVTFTSSVTGDPFTSTTCVLAPVAASLNSSSCQVGVMPAVSGVRQITAIYGGSLVHTGSQSAESLTVNERATTLTVDNAAAYAANEPQNVALSATVSSSLPVDEGTVTFTVRDGNGAIVGAPVTSGPVVAGAATATFVLPGPTLPQTLTITAVYTGVNRFLDSTGSGALDVTPRPFTYLLAEGATGAFLDTDILLANPNSVAAPATIRFLTDAGATITQQLTLAPTSRTTIHVDQIAGLESASFSTIVTSTSMLPLVVERTMRWNADGYGSDTEKATEGPALTWFFAEGSQGYFHTYFLLANPYAVANVAHVTYLLDGGGTVQRDYPMAPASRLTIDAVADAALVDRSFGATITFDRPGMAERAMYFDADQPFAGGSAASGVTAPSTSWRLAEGATGTFFSTFLLITNPGTAPATLTVNYLLDTGATVTRVYPLPGQQRLTVNAALQDPLLAGASFAVSVDSDQPVVLERSMYWPASGWYESHTSTGVTAAGQRWGLAEGQVGGATHAQTYVLVGNPGSTPADLTVTFMRTNGTTVLKTFRVAAMSRLNIAVAGPGSHVPELVDESFATIVESTQPVVVERSLYADDVNGVPWAAGGNATGTRLP